MTKQIQCSNCKSLNIIKSGFRTTENRGKIQRYKCIDCKLRFVVDDGFYRMKNSPQKITCAIDLFYRGVSTRKVQEHFQAFYPHNSSHKSIYKWIVKYSQVISRYTDNLKLNVGSEMQLDEDWFIDSIDTKTRFMVASSYGKSRGYKELKQVAKLAKSRTGDQFKIITTDGLNVYPRVLRKTFGLNKMEGKSKIKHNKVLASENEGFNYPIERLHNSIRARTKTFRGFHGSVESANAIMKGYEIYYNFITRHQTLNCCPYELAVPELKLNGLNKWLELIKIATL